MTTKVIFNTNKKAKELAMKEAKSRGLPLTYFLNQTILALAGMEKNHAPVFTEVTPNKEEVRAIKKGAKEIAEGDFILLEDVFKEIGYTSKYK